MMEPVAAITGPEASIFFIAVVLLGKCLLINLLVAVILTEFGDDSNPALSPGKTPRASRTPSPLTSRSPETTHFGDETARLSPAIHGLSPEGFSGSRPASPEKLITDVEWPRDYTLLCFSPLNPIRRFCRAAVRNPWYNRAIILAIILSSVGLALDSPRLDQQSVLAARLQVFYLVIVVFFFTEMVMKVITLGFVFGEGAYLKSPWNQLDFLIVLVSILLLVGSSLSYRTVHLRFWCAQPLRGLAERG